MIIKTTNFIVENYVCFFAHLLIMNSRFVCVFMEWQRQIQMRNQGKPALNNGMWTLNTKKLKECTARKNKIQSARSSRDSFSNIILWHYFIVKTLAHGFNYCCVHFFHVFFLVFFTLRRCCRKEIQRQRQ